MIKHWYFTGDIHADLNRFYSIENSLKRKGFDTNECGVIVLGDVGLNYFLDHRDRNLKKKFMKNCGYTIYCLKGNHEARPRQIEGMKKKYDTEVCGYVYYEEEYPNIKYFLDMTGSTYTINGYKFLTIGGAYSVDKFYRLQQGWNWFADEQLSKGEMSYIENKTVGNIFDFVLTHTCPLSWQPTDLFLNAVNQDLVDNSMEKWLEEIKDKISWKVWLFGHYHDDRLVRPGVEMLYNDLVEMEYFVDTYIKKTKEISPFYNFDPKYKE